MDGQSYFGRYSLSSESLKKLQEIKELLKKDGFEANSAWMNISRESEERTQYESDQNDDEDGPVKPKDITCVENLTQKPSQATQYYSTQGSNSGSPFVQLTQEGNQLLDITASLYEALERNNGKFDPAQLLNLTDSELLGIVNGLRVKLSLQGIYNLCLSIFPMEIEHRIRYTSLICTNLLLPKLIAIEEPSRLMNTIISECVEKFPEDIQKLIFVPMLNADLKNTSAIFAIVNSSNVYSKRTLIFEFLAAVKELKQWHISLLQILLIPHLDASTKDKLIGLLSKKSFDFSKDKTYGKLILNLVKTNAPFTEEQKQLLEDIAAVNTTFFKKSIENSLRN